MIATELFLQRYAEDYSIKLDKSTIGSYQRAIRQLVTFSNKSFDQIEPNDIRHWFLNLEEKGYEPTTVQRNWTRINMFYKYCLEEGVISNHPLKSIPFPKSTESEPYYLEANQLTKLRNLVKGNIEEQAMIDVFYSTGVRLSEFMDIKISDINWSEGTIHIPKGKFSIARIVVFTRVCSEYMQSYLQKRNDGNPYLFINKTGKGQINRVIIYERFNRYREELGFYLSPHTLRHTFAAHLAQKGMPLSGIQALLGHENPKNTKIYSRLYDHARKNKYDEWM